MPNNLMQRAAAMLGTKLKSSAVAGRSVRYWRGALGSEVLQAVCDQHGTQVASEDAANTSFRWYDWQFTTTDMLLRGEQIIPQQGDKITETLNGVESEYEVLPTPETKRCYEAFDSSGVLTLVHTKKTK